jgi:hypothetical protein
MPDLRPTDLTPLNDSPADNDLIEIVDVDDTTDSAEGTSKTVTKAELLAELAKSNALTAHTSATNNPHNVTKTQVGLGYVNNTADADKPISTAAAAKNASQDAAITLNTAKRSYPAADQTKVANLPADTNSALATKADTSSLATVATTGSYDDLSDKPSIPTGESFTTAEKAKLGAIEASADRTDTANVTAAGALMDSEVANLSAVKDFDPSEYATDAQGVKADSAVQPAAIADFETTTELNARDTANRNRSNHTGTQPASTVTGLATVATSNSYDDLDDKPDLSNLRTIEQFEDAVAAMFQRGTHVNASVSYDDATGALSVTATGGGGGGGGATLTEEQVEDFVGGLITQGTGINVTYDDAGNALSVALTGVSFTQADKNKLDGIAAGATQNSTDAQLRARSSHTGTQAISTVAGLQDELDGKAATTHSHSISQVTGLQTALNGKVDDLQVQTNVPANAVFTDTVYDDTAIQAEVDANTAKRSYPSADETKLAGIEAGATADQTDAEIETAYNNRVNKVSAAEITAGTETNVRRFSPADAKAMIDEHGGGGDLWSDPVDADIVPALDQEVEIGAFNRRFLGGYFSNITVSQQVDVLRLIPEIIQDYRVATRRTQSIGNLGTSQALNLSDYGGFVGTLDQSSCTLAFTTVAGNNNATYNIALTGTASTAGITWPSGVVWFDNNDGSAPAVPGDGEILSVTLVQISPTVWHASATGNYQVYS